MPLQIKNLALAAALALGGVTATDVVPAPQAQAEKEVQRDGGNLKLLRAAALKGQEVQRDAIPPFVPDTKRRDQNSGDAPFLGRQLLEKYIDPKILVERVSVLEASEAKLEREDDELAQSISVLGTSQERLTGRVGDLEKLAPSISVLEASQEGLTGRVDVLAPSISVLQESQERLTGRVDGLAPSISGLEASQERLTGSISVLEASQEGLTGRVDVLAPSISVLQESQERLTGRVDDLIAQSISELEVSQEGLTGRVDVLSAQMEGLIRRVDNLENSSGEMTFAEARDRARARDEINQLSQYEFLNLISLSDGPGRAALTRARTHYRYMFAGVDFASYDIMDIFLPSEWEDIYVKFGIDGIDQSDPENRHYLPAQAIIKTNDLHLSEWQIPENADVDFMFEGSTNVPDLSNWILTNEYTWGRQNTVYYMFYNADVTDELKCPCVNGYHCCAGALHHGEELHEHICAVNQEYAPSVRCGQD